MHCMVTIDHAVGQKYPTLAGGYVFPVHGFY